MLTQVSYSLYHLLVDLLQFAASHLRWNFLHNNMISESWLLFSREGGRLVYWLPVIRQIYNSDLTPSHPCLTLVEDCEQVLLDVAIMCGKPWIRCWAVIPVDALLSWRENLERWSWTKLKIQEKTGWWSSGSCWSAVGRVQGAIHAPCGQCHTQVCYIGYLKTCALVICAEDMPCFQEREAS